MFSFLKKTQKNQTQKNQTQKNQTQKNQTPKPKNQAPSKEDIIEDIKSRLIEYFSEHEKVDEPDTWKKVIDDTGYLDLLFDLDDKLAINFAKIEEKLDFLIQRNELVLSDTEKANILNELKPLTKPADELFKSRTKKIIERFQRVITPANVNAYVEHSSNFNKDKKDVLWRRGEKFTPVLYLAKISPICSESMLLILLKAGANLSMRAATVGCLSYPSLNGSFFKKRHCTTIGKLARKVYFRNLDGMDKALIRKTAEMYACLKDMNDGVFLEKRKYLTENPELIKGIDFNYWKLDRSQSLIKRTWRCRYLDSITKPNTSLGGCGIPGVSKYSEMFQKIQIPRIGKLLLGTGSAAGLILAPIAGVAAATGVVIIPGGIILIPLALMFFIGVATNVDRITTSRKGTINLIDTANKTSAEVLKNNQDMLFDLVKKEIIKAPPEEEPDQTQKVGGVRRNKTRRLS